MSTNSFSIARLYLKSTSIEVPDMARLPKLAVQPEIAVDLQTDVKPAWAGHIECILTISLHGKLNGKTMFLIEVSQAGVFKVAARTSQEIARFAKESAAEVLFPYARKHLAAMAVSAGFQPVILDHVDFAALLRKLAERPPSRPAEKKQPPAPAPVKAPTPSPQLALPLAGNPSAGGVRPESRDTPAPPRSSTPPAAQSQSIPPEVPVPSQPKTPALHAPARHTNLWASASIIAFFAGACAIWFWPRGSAPVIAPPPLAASVPAKLAAEQEKQKLLERGERIVAASQARLAEQPETAYTLELGTLSGAEAVPALEALPTRRALFVDYRADGSLAVLYGIYPDATLARAAEAELAPQFPAALAQHRRVLRLDDRVRVRKSVSDGAK